MDRNPFIWSYVVAYDGGFAPCTDNNLLTLCICKPLIRRSANIGDWLVGFAKKKLGQNLITYVAEITEKVSMETYFLDSTPRLDKIYKIIDDNIIHYGGDIHKTSRNWKTDVSGKYCLISKNFWYFGKSPITNIEELQDLYHPYIGQKKVEKSEYLDNLKWFITKYKNSSNFEME